jgi:hypothetical protein
MRKLLILLCCSLSALLLVACIRAISRDEAAELLRASPTFTAKGPRRREIVRIKWIVRYAPDTPYDYDVGFDWRWQDDPRTFDSVAEFTRNGNRWVVQDFKDENRKLVEIGVHGRQSDRGVGVR